MTAPVRDRNHEEIILSEPLLTVADAARLLSVRESWVREAVRDGRLPHVRLGRHVRFTRSGLEAFIRQRFEPARTA